MTKHSTILIAAGMIMLQSACQNEPPTPTGSAQSADLKPIEKRLDLLQKRQQEDRNLLIAQISELQQTVSRLENQIGELAQGEKERSTSMPDDQTKAKPARPPSKTPSPSSPIKESEREENSQTADPPRIRVRGTTQTLRDDYLDPPTGTNPDWFPLNVHDVSLVRKETGHRVMTRVEKTGEMVKDENGQLQEETVRLQEKIPTYAYEVSVTLKSRLKKAQEVRVTAGGESVSVNVGPGERKAVTLPATPNAPLVVETGRWSRSFPVDR